jgi:hypothetical protein
MSWFLDLKFLFFYSFVYLFYFLIIFFSFLLLLFFPLWWDNDRLTTQTPTPGLDAEGVTPELLRLKLYCIWTWDIFFFFLCLSNACLIHCWLVHYLSLLISLALYFFLFCLFFLCFLSPITFPF